MEEISIIIPFYNGENYIEKCLNSLVSQTYNNIKIYCIDDGSTDKSKKIIEEFMQKDKRIYYFYKENGGVSSARNFGIQMANSKWITFVDVDDTLPENAIQDFISPDMSKYDIIIGKINIINNKDITESRNLYGKTHDITNKDEVYESIIFNKDYTKYTYIEMPFSKLYRLDFINNNIIRFPMGLKYGEDVIFNMEAICKSGNIKFINNTVYNYYINSKSVSNAFDFNLTQNYDVFLEELRKKLKDLNLYDLYKKQLDYFVFRQLIKYCRKYFFNKNNKNSKEENRRQLGEILKEEKYFKALKDIDINYLSKKQKLVRYLMLKNNYFTLSIIFKL